jgi:hypothetical protein
LPLREKLQAETFLLEGKFFSLFSGIPHERAPKGTFFTIAPGLEPVMLHQ